MQVQILPVVLAAAHPVFALVRCAACELFGKPAAVFLSLCSWVTGIWHHGLIHSGCTAHADSCGSRRARHMRKGSEGEI